MSESRPKNMAMHYYIKASGDGIPVGYIALLPYAPGDGWLACDGAPLLVNEYPALYSEVGDKFYPEYLTEFLPRPAWQRLLIRLGVYFKPRTITKPNPDYCPGFFRVPNLSRPGREAT